MMWLQLLGGLVFLVVGAELLVRGAGSIARKMGIAVFVVGYVIVGFGTSSPEVSTSLSAHFNHDSLTAWGNIFGSNAFNLAIMGIAMMITPIALTRAQKLVDIPLVVFGTLIVFLLAQNGLSEMEGLFIMSGFAMYILIMARQNGKQKSATQDEEIKLYPWGVSAVMVGVAFPLLMLGGKWVVDSANVIVAQYGLNPKVAGIVISACGTSLPEATTSIIAAIRKQTQLILGNILGSCLFNVIAISGICAAANKFYLPAELYFDIIAGVALAILLFIFGVFGKVKNMLTRIEGLLLFGGWAIYLYFSITL